MQMRIHEGGPADARREHPLVARLRGRRVPTYVARAVHDATKLVVIEHLVLGPGAYAEAVERATLLRDAPHPRLMRLRAAVERSSGIDVVSEFIDGESLVALLALLREKSVALSAMCALRIVSDVLSGLHALHRMPPFAARGHGALSPHTVIVGLDGRSRLVEIVRDAGSEHRADVSRFVDPTTIDAGESTPATDLYAAGVILADLLGAHAESAEYAAPFLEVATRARAPALGDRFADAAEMLSALASHFRDRAPSHADVARLMTALAGDAAHARRVALEKAPILEPSELRRALSPPASMPAAYLEPTASPHVSGWPASIPPDPSSSAPPEAPSLASLATASIPPAPLLPSVASRPPPRSTPSQPSPEMSVIVAADPPVAALPPVPTALPPMPSRQATSPDLALGNMAVEEREHRSPRLLILCITILLVGIALGVLVSQRTPAAAAPSHTVGPAGQHP